MVRFKQWLEAEYTPMEASPEEVSHAQIGWEPSKFTLNTVKGF